MLSEERTRQIQTEATARADSLSDEALRMEAVETFVRWNDSPDGDEKEELQLRDQINTREMVRRGMTAD